MQLALWELPMHIICIEYRQTEVWRYFLYHLFIRMYLHTSKPLFFKKKLVHFKIFLYLCTQIGTIFVMRAPACASNTRYAYAQLPAHAINKEEKTI